MKKAEKILIIDDDVDLLMMLEQSLSSSPYVRTSRNWLDGYKRLSEEKFDLILLDIMLPDSLPLNALRAIHELDMDYPVILMSGSPEIVDELLDQIMGLGVNHVLAKPFSSEELFDFIASTFPGLIEKPKQ